MKFQYVALLGWGVACVANAGQVDSKDVYGANVVASFERSLEPMKAVDLALLKQQPIRLSMLAATQSDDALVRSHDIIMH